MEKGWVLDSLIETRQQAHALAALGVIAKHCGTSAVRFYCQLLLQLLLKLQLLLLLLHPFNDLFSRTTWVSRYQKGKTSLDLNEARGDV